MSWLSSLFSPSKRASKKGASSRIVLEPESTTALSVPVVEESEDVHYSIDPVPSSDTMLEEEVRHQPPPTPLAPPAPKPASLNRYSFSSASSSSRYDPPSKRMPAAPSASPLTPPPPPAPSVPSPSPSDDPCSTGTRYSFTSASRESSDRISAPPPARTRAVAPVRPPRPPREEERRAYPMRLRPEQLQEAILNKVRGASAKPTSFGIFEQLVEKHAKGGKRDLYKEDIVTRQVICSWRNAQDDYLPNRKTFFRIILALHLSLKEANELLTSAGYAFSPHEPLDTLVKSCLETKFFDRKKNRQNARRLRTRFAFQR